MSKEVKNITASIKSRLINIAKKENMTFDSILLLYMQERLQEAVKETLQRRHTLIEKQVVIFTDDFIKNDDRKKMWKTFLKKINEKNNINFEDVMTNITAFLKPLYDSIAYEMELFK